MSAHTIPIPIRFRDIDMHQHVNNAVYFTYMEYARSAILLKEMQESLNKGIQFLVAEANCKYIRPIKLDDHIQCKVEFVPVRPTSCDIVYTFRNEKTEEVHAEGITRMVLFNSHRGRPAPIPEWFSDKYLNT